MRTAAELLACVLLAIALTSCGGGSSTPPNNSGSGSGSASAPSITVQPANQTVPLGQSATFSVTATGAAPLSYQWQKNGANISGATGASYTTPPVTNADNGAQFKAVVSN